TPTELEHDIARRLVAADILRSPHVTVLVAEYRSRVVAVSGSVERPGLYPITKPGTTLTDILWAAGCPNRDAGRVIEFVPVVDGDVIRLPVSASRVVPWGMWTVAREMVHVGGNVLLF